MNAQALREVVNRLHRGVLSAEALSITGSECTCGCEPKNDISKSISIL